MSDLSHIDCIVLAAGKGERLGEITRRVPKPMLCVDGEPILEQNLKWLARQGAQNIWINLHYLPQVIKEHFADGEKMGLSIRYSFEETLLGTAGGAKKIFEEQLGKDDDALVLVVYGDNLFNDGFDLLAMIEAHQQKETRVTVGLYRNDREIAKSGVVVLSEQGEVLRHIEKPQGSQLNEVTVDGEHLKNNCFINAGLYLLDRSLFADVPEGLCDFGRDLLPQWIKEKTGVCGYPFQALLRAVDTPELYKEEAE